MLLFLVRNPLLMLETSNSDVAVKNLEEVETKGRIEIKLAELNEN
jgi:hypothetical protein